MVQFPGEVRKKVLLQLFLLLCHPFPMVSGAVWSCQDGPQLAWALLPTSLWHSCLQAWVQHFLLLSEKRPLKNLSVVKKSFCLIQGISRWVTGAAAPPQEPIDAGSGLPECTGTLGLTWWQGNCLSDASVTEAFHQNTVTGLAGAVQLPGRPRGPWRHSPSGRDRVSLKFPPCSGWGWWALACVGSFPETPPLAPDPEDHSQPGVRDDAHLQ